MLKVNTVVYTYKVSGSTLTSTLKFDEEDPETTTYKKVTEKPTKQYTE